MFFVSFKFKTGGEFSIPISSDFAVMPNFQSAFDLTCELINEIISGLKEKEDYYNKFNSVPVQDFILPLSEFLKNKHLVDYQDEELYIQFNKKENFVSIHYYQNEWSLISTVEELSLVKGDLTTGLLMKL